MFVDLVNPERVRQMIRDVDELNVILSYEEQFEDSEIFDAAQDAEDEAFARYPALATFDRIPVVAIHFMVISYLLEAVANQENRNQMQINDDNVGNIDYSNKASQYLSLANTYKQKAMEIFQSITAANYYKEMWGEVSSNSYDFEGNY